MTELLSREKEFLKLNEQLDKLASSALEQQLPPQQQQQQLLLQQQQQQTSNNTTTATTSPHHHHHNQQHHAQKGETKFLTYTKQQRNGVQLKKRGAGDCIPDHENHAIHQKERFQGSSVRDTYRTGRNRTTALPHATATSTTVSSGVPCNKVASPTGDVRKDTSNFTTATATTTVTSISTGASLQRKNVKSPDSSMRTFTRSNTSRMTQPASGTFTVKYRNPKFVESPSLEVLVKDESASIRRKMSPTAAPSSVRMPTDLESVASTTGETSGSTVRRSQGGTRKQITTEGLIKFLKSKITILEEDHERICQEMSQQKEQLEKTLERQKKVELQRDQAYAKHNALSEQLTKVESQLEEANKRGKERIMEQSSQQKEIEQVKRELKVLTQTNTNLEKKLYRANEDLETTKNALTFMKTAERELRETMRAESEGKDKQIKSLKKQRADLLNAYKKQLFLIDNLKRQNICMEQSKMISFGEKEFTKVLEWNTKT